MPSVRVFREDPIRFLAGYTSSVCRGFAEIFFGLIRVRLTGVPRRQHNPETRHDSERQQKAEITPMWQAKNGTPNWDGGRIICDK